MATNTVVRGEKKKLSQRSKVFFMGVWAELKKVHWPTKQEIAKYTLVVLTAVLLMAIVLGVLDTVFSWCITKLLSLAGV